MVQESQELEYQFSQQDSCQATRSSQVHTTVLPCKCPVLLIEWQKSPNRDSITTISLGILRIVTFFVSCRFRQFIAGGQRAKYACFGLFFPRSSFELVPILKQGFDKPNKVPHVN